MKKNNKNNIINVGSLDNTFNLLKHRKKKLRKVDSVINLRDTNVKTSQSRENKLQEKQQISEDRINSLTSINFNFMNLSPSLSNSSLSESYSSQSSFSSYSSSSSTTF